MNKFILIASAILALASCRTIKEVEKTKLVVDSTVITENNTLRRELQETTSRHEAERESWASTGVVFDTVVVPGDTVRISKVEFHDNGRIKSVEGRLRSVTQSEQERTAELLDAHTTIDSLVIELDRKDAQLSKKVDTIVKEVKRTVWPWWLYLICLVAGLVLESRFKLLTRLKGFIIGLTGKKLFHGSG